MANKDKKPTGPKDDSETAKGIIPSLDDVDGSGEQDPANITSIPERVPPAEEPVEKPSMRADLIASLLEARDRVVALSQPPYDG